jgi:hypothetical protein
MSKRQPVEIGGVKFDKKGDALDYLKDILGKYKPEETVVEQDSIFLRQALDRHPEAQEKIGCGVASFFVRRADFSTTCFWIKRTDGTVVRFSYKSCV